VWHCAIEDLNIRSQKLRAGLKWGLVALTATIVSACQSDPNQAPYDGAMVLAISWQSAFCERAKRRPECRRVKPDRYDTTNFALHGLWPQPGSNIYCGVSDKDIASDKKRRWRQLAGLGLSDELKQKLWQMMPGAQSFLHRHEWIKHGTCYSNSPEVYYQDSVKLLAEINASEVQKLFAQSIGQELSGAQIRSAFDQAFGKGAGDRVRIACKRDGKRMLITELTVGLRGSAQKDMAELIANAPTTKKGCPGGLVDQVGFQ
jgi:ribonuclease T2